MKALSLRQICYPAKTYYLFPDVAKITFAELQKKDAELQMLQRKVAELQRKEAELQRKDAELQREVAERAQYVETRKEEASIRFQTIRTLYRYLQKA